MITTNGLKKKIYKISIDLNYITIFIKIKYTFFKYFIMDSRFSAYIVSNGSKEFFPENSLSKFSVKFPFSLDLDIDKNEKWGISINSIGLSSKFESKYESYKQDPLIIHMINLNDLSLCELQKKTPESIVKCKIIGHDRNMLLFDKTYNKCYFPDDGGSEYCKIKDLRKYFYSWAYENLYYGSDIQSQEKTGRIQQFNYHFNNLENEADVESLMKELKEADLIVTKLKKNTYKIKSANNIEKIIFLRQDLVLRCEITQDIKFVSNDLEHNTLKASENPLFRNLSNARSLNNSFVRPGSHNYKIYV